MADQTPLQHPLATTAQNPFGTQTNGNPMMGGSGLSDIQDMRDPLEKGKVRAQAMTITREVPLVVVQTGWDVPQVRSALESLVIGLFDAPAQLVDAVIGDSRVHSALSQRTGGLLGRPISFKAPSDKPEAQSCLDAWLEHWPTMGAEPVLSDMLGWSSLLGFWMGQLLWDTQKTIWKPYAQTWHPRYSYYHWTFRRYMAMAIDGQVPVTPGDGHWLLHAPHGSYRGWMRGALRPIAPWWLARNYALRDWARYSERHGMPIGKAITPFGADKDEIVNYRSQIAQLGQESILQLPQSSDPAFGKYDLEWLETTDQAWDGFQGLINQCNTEVTMALLGQNLTSEVKEGSFAAARVHGDVRQIILEADARALAQTIYLQFARPFAAVNFGDPDLAPRTTWDVSPDEDHKALADTFLAFSSAVKTLKESGKATEDLRALGKKFGLNLGEWVTPARTVEAFHIMAGAITMNEVRAGVGLPPIPEGDKLIKAAKPQPANTNGP